MAADAEDIIKKIYSITNKDEMMKIKENVNKLNIDVNEFIVEQETRLEFNIFSEKKTEIKMLGSKRIHTVDEIDNPIKLLIV